MGADISRQFQPAQRGTAVGCALAISAFAYFFPDAVGEGGQHMVKFVHLVSCSAWLGVQFWVSFVAGLMPILSALWVWKYLRKTRRPLLNIILLLAPVNVQLKTYMYHAFLQSYYPPLKMRYIGDLIVLNNKKSIGYFKDIYPSELNVEKANGLDDQANYLALTFIIGLTKIKLLPRHTFGYVQRHLFGKYYLYGTGFMSVGLATYLMLHPFKDWIGGGNINIQGWSLVLNLASTIVTMLAIEPALNREMDKMHKFEKEHGQGEEIGPITEKKLLENETYKGLRSNFFLWHGVATSVNLIAFTASGVHFWFMSKQINF